MSIAQKAGIENRAARIARWKRLETNKKQSTKVAKEKISRIVITTIAKGRSKEDLQRVS